MKKYLKTNRINLLIVIAFSVFTSCSYLFDFQEGKTIYRENFIPFFKEMILFLPFMFILIGLADVWISKDKVERLIGGNSGVKGTIYVILLSMIQAGPLYGAFPVAFLLFKKGASIKNIFIYIGAFSTLKIPMLMFEIGFLGLKFSLIRTLVTLPFIILISVIMEKILENKKFQIHDGVPHNNKWMAWSNVTKRYICVLFIVVSLIVLSCNHKSIDSDKSSMPLSSETFKCYSFSNDKDTIFLSMEYKGDRVVGNLVYHLFQKDSNSGVIKGYMEKDLLIADYSFQSEGMQSLRQVVFKRVGNDFIEGYGEIENRNGASYFRNIDSLKFNSSMVLKSVNCPPAK